MKVHVTANGEIRKCSAKYNCPLKGNDGEDLPHFNTKREAIKFVEEQEKGRNETFVKLSKNSRKSWEKIPLPVSYDEKGWGTVLSLESLEAHLVSEGVSFPDDPEERKRLLSISKEAIERVRIYRENKYGKVFTGMRDVHNGEPGYWQVSYRPGFRGKPINFVEDYVGQRDNPKDLPDSFMTDSWKEIVRPSELFRSLSGLAEAQKQMVAGDNNENAGYYTLYSGNVSQYSDEIVRRILMGEESKYVDTDDEENILYNRNFVHLSPKEKFFRRVTNGGDDPYRFDNQMFYALKFPETHLLPELDKNGINNVEVTPMSNGREQGLVYTVQEPNGNTRSFSIYEHRNTDSIIINCETNYAPTPNHSVGPRPKMNDGEDNKWNFVAEFAYGTNPKVVAETMSFFLKEAQNGDLDDDDTLVRKSERLDWNAIISERVPMFAEWMKVQEMKELEETFKRIKEEDDFDKWNRELKE